MPALLVVLAGAVAISACAPKPTVTERYCDVVKRGEATVDPFAVPSVLADPGLLKAALESRTKLFADLLALAPDAVRADLNTMQVVQRSVQGALAAASYVSSAANEAPVPGLLGSPAYAQARGNVARFDGRTCDLAAGDSSPRSSTSSPTGSSSSSAAETSSIAGTAPVTAPVTSLDPAGSVAGTITLP